MLCLTHVVIHHFYASYHVCGWINDWRFSCCVLHMSSYIIFMPLTMSVVGLMTGDFRVVSYTCRHTSFAFSLAFYPYSENSDFESLYEFSGAFGEWQKATASFVMSICPSAWMNSVPTFKDFHEMWYLWIFLKSLEKIHLSLRSDKNKG